MVLSTNPSTMNTPPVAAHSATPAGPGNPASHAAGRRPMSLSSREAIWGYLFISPWLIGLIWFSLGPIGGVIYFSFNEYSVLEAPHWVGLQNYRKIFGDDPLFW